MNQQQTHSSWHQQETYIQTASVAVHTLSNQELLAHHNLLARSAIALNDQQMQQLSAYQAEVQRRGLSATQSQKGLAFLNGTFMGSWPLWQQLTVLVLGGIVSFSLLRNLLFTPSYVPMPAPGGNTYIIK